jgi:hypothetical protein
MSHLEDVQTAIEQVYKDAGFTCDPGWINLSLPVEDLPGAVVTRAVGNKARAGTMTMERKVRFRADMIFGLDDPAAFRSELLTLPDAVQDAVLADPSLGGLVEYAHVTEDQPPSQVEAAAAIAVQSVWIDVEWEENA